MLDQALDLLALEWCRVPVRIGHRQIGSDSDPWPNHPDVNAERAGILLEVMRDLLYQTFVRKARLVQAVTFRKFVAPNDEAEAG